jgi:hypothetical protein
MIFRATSTHSRLTATALLLSIVITSRLFFALRLNRYHLSTSGVYHNFFSAHYQKTGCYLICGFGNSRISAPCNLR